ncbi:hypothetical protein HEK616_82580 (plasmid) [Streptomyces nigrescens]|uniref:Uncharacterized protein n=1 Tax=Streptomyces nigrescens TaxID=1920 RepID=A0ABM8A7Q2_STRNI|nr:hypothetical protein HEK616_82580 [Streptomyces nigrescens]
MVADLQPVNDLRTRQLELVTTVFPHPFWASCPDPVSARTALKHVEPAEPSLPVKDDQDGFPLDVSAPLADVTLQDGQHLKAQVLRRRRDRSGVWWFDLALELPDRGDWRSRSPSASLASRTWKSRPGTRPWRTALAHSSAVMRVSVPLMSLS